MKVPITVMNRTTRGISLWVMYREVVYTAIGAVNAQGGKPLLAGSWIIHVTAQAERRTKKPAALRAGFERHTRKNGMNSSDKRDWITSTVPAEENANAQ
ncbi:hypothetical protein ACUY2X_02100 [Corynebacterium minutissimum]